MNNVNTENGDSDIDAETEKNDSDQTKKFDDIMNKGNTEKDRDIDAEAEKNPYRSGCKTNNSDGKSMRHRKSL